MPLLDLSWHSDIYFCIFVEAFMSSKKKMPLYLSLDSIPVSLLLIAWLRFTNQSDGKIQITILILRWGALSISDKHNISISMLVPFRTIECQESRKLSSLIKMPIKLWGFICRISELPSIRKQTNQIRMMVPLSHEIVLYYLMLINGWIVSEASLLRKLHYRKGGIISILFETNFSARNVL